MGRAALAEAEPGSAGHTGGDLPATRTAVLPVGRDRMMLLLPGAMKDARLARDGQPSPVRHR